MNRKFMIVSMFICAMLIIVIVDKEINNYVEYENVDNNNNNVVFAAEYSDNYDRIFGEFVAKTSVKLLKDKQENTCYSPVSLYAALTLLAENTEAETNEELIMGLGVENIGQLEEVYEKMLDDIWINTDVNTSRLTLANSLWINNKLLDENSYEVIQRCEEKLDCQLFACDSVVPEEVNKWIKEKTDGLINKVLDNEEFCDLALVNTLYYSSKWGTKFSDIGKKEFKLNDGNVIETKYISDICENMRYKVCEEYIIADVAMKNGNMIFVLPDENKKLEDLLVESKINEIMALISGEQMDKASVGIKLPVFECEDYYEDEFVGVLESMGIESLYEASQWKLSHQLDNKSVNIRQKSKIIVDKNGIEVAAATGGMVIVAGETPASPKVDITINRPFLYVLMKDGVPLFIGTVYNPAQ